jgi:Fur family peroxide stress response transcriptional regulator
VSHTEDRVRRLVTALRAGRHRLTPQRLAVLRVLTENPGHPSVEQVYEEVRRQHPMISRATVYKTVETLKGMGEVLELEFSGTGNRYDGRRVEPHPHLICRGCGSIRDLELPGLMREATEVAEKTGYELLGHRLDFYGLCPDCRGRRAIGIAARQREPREVTDQ